MFVFVCVCVCVCMWCVSSHPTTLTPSHLTIHAKSYVCTCLHTHTTHTHTHVRACVRVCARARGECVCVCLCVLTAAESSSVRLTPASGRRQKGHAFRGVDEVRMKKLGNHLQQKVRPRELTRDAMGESMQVVEMQVVVERGAKKGRASEEKGDIEREGENLRPP